MKTINIGGLDRPLNFGTNALCEFEDLTGVSIWNGFKADALDFRKMRALVYVGLKWGAKEEQRQFEYEIEEIGNWIGLDMNLLEKVTDIFVESMPKGEASGDETKKKT